MTPKKHDRRTWVRAGIPVGKRRQIRIWYARLTAFAAMPGAVLSEDACAMLYDAAMGVESLLRLPVVDDEFLEPDAFAMLKENHEVSLEIGDDADELDA